MADVTRLPHPINENWAWQLQAACRGLETSLFFHAKHERGPARERRIAAAKEVCYSCPVIAECRQYALDAREPYGVWGGLSEDERADILGLRSIRYPAKRTDCDESDKDEDPTD